MSDSSNHDKKDEIKPVLGYPHSEQFPQSDHNFAPPYPNPTYHYPPPYDQYPYQYPYYYYPNYQSIYYNDHTNTNNDDNNNNNNNNNNIAQPQSSNAPPRRRKTITFCRVLFCLIFVLILSVSIFLVVRFWKNYTYYPSFKVASFVVHSFNISNSTNTLNADWELEVSVRNSNRKVEISFEYIATSLMYNLQLLESSFSAPINVPPKSNTNFHVDSNIPNLNQVKIGGLVVNEMARDFRSGEDLLIDLRIEANIINKVDNKHYRRRVLFVLCDDLILKFKNSSSLPEWDGHINNYKRVCNYESWWDTIWPPW